MDTHVSIWGTEATDRLEICELVDAYAHCADRRDAITHSYANRFLHITWRHDAA
jgi:hypothetical protein